MFNDFLEPDYGIDNSPVDNTRIIQIILYYNEEEAKDMKRLAKKAMKAEMPKDYIDKGNLSDLFLTMLKKYYDGKDIEIENEDQRPTSGKFESDFLD